jgi:hypothetical protein
MENQIAKEDREERRSEAKDEEAGQKGEKRRE